MVIVRPSLAVVHWAASGQVRQAAANLAVPACRPVAARMGTVTAGRAGDGLAVEAGSEAVLGKVTFHRGRRLAFDAVIDAGAVYPFEEFAGAVGGIAVGRGWPWPAEAAACPPSWPVALS